MARGKIYENTDGKCECWECEIKNDCAYAFKYQRLPREKANGALGLCPKLRKEGALK